MVSRPEALEAYFIERTRLGELDEERDRIAQERANVQERISELHIIIFAEQVKPQREPRKGGYQPRGRSKEIVGAFLGNLPFAYGSWISASQLREACNLTSDQVQQALAELRKEGLVNRQGNQGHHTYQLAIRKENEQNENTHGDSIAKLSDIPGFPNSGS